MGASVAPMRPGGSPRRLLRVPQWWTASSRIVLALATAALAAAATPALGATPSAKGEPVRSSPCSWKPSKGTKSAPDAALKDQLGKKLHGSEALVELYAIDPTIKNATQRAVQRAVSDLQYEADLHKGEPGPPVFGFGQNWRLANNVALQVLPAHMKRAVKCVRENVSIAPGGELVLQQDPVAEWWPSVVGADALASVGPNVPVTIIDAGVDLTHPDFAGRAETAALNEQAVESGETHGTAAFSLIGAPANGVGTVGVYPQASVRLWDMP